MRREADRERELSDELSDALRSPIEAREVSLSRLSHPKIDDNSLGVKRSNAKLKSQMKLKMKNCRHPRKSTDGKNK